MINFGFELALEYLVFFIEIIPIWNIWTFIWRLIVERTEHIYKDTVIIINACRIGERAIAYF